MICEVGGTLGIFLNFSFTNVFTRLLILIQSFLNGFFFKKLKSPPKIKDIEDESDVKKSSIVVFEMNQRFYQDRLSSLEMDLNEIKEKINKLGDEKSKLKEMGYSNKTFAQEDTAPKSIVGNSCL